jgi:hypothetical protein
MKKKVLTVTKFGIGSLLLLAILGNSGCLVDTGSDLVDPKPITQKHLRIYKNGDEIHYDVRIDILKGTIVTKWVDVPFEDNLDAKPLEPGFQPFPEPILKETTTFEYDGSTEQINVVRYISQNTDENSPTYGAITVHAFNSQSGPPLFDYVHDAPSLSGDPVPTVVMPSPLLNDSGQPITDQDFPISFYVLPCNSGANTCQTANQSYIDNLLLTQMIKENLETTLDYFETIKVPFTSGNITDQDVLEPNIRLDIKGWCGDVNDQNITFSGSEWIYPAIGIVRYEITCTGSTTNSFQANVTSVNFSY